MATLATLEANVGKPLGLDYTGADKTELDQKINDGVVDILRRTACYVASTTISLSAGTTDYTLAASILRIVTLYTTASGTNYYLERVSPADITDMQVRSSSSNSPVFNYALIGANLLSVYPAPSGSDTINIRYVPRPTALSGASDDPSSASLGGIPSEYHYGIELYALWKMADSTDDQSSGQGERYRLQYEGDPQAPVGTPARLGFVGQMRAETNRKGGDLPRARGPRRFRRNVNHRNDIY